MAEVTEDMHDEVVDENDLSPRPSIADEDQPVVSSPARRKRVRGKRKNKQQGAVEDAQQDDDSSSWKWLFTFVAGQVPPGRSNHIAFVLRENQMGLFGGFGSTRIFNDVYVLNTQSMIWTKPRVTGRPPSDRVYSYAAATVGKFLYLFGGYMNDTQEWLQDLHLLNLDILEWSKPVMSGEIPSHRAAHSMCVVGDYLYLYGGNNQTFFYSDMYRLHVDTLVWERVDTQGPTPPARAGHSATAIGNKIFVFGGGVGDRVFNDIWLFDTETHTWTQPPLTGIPPSARAGHSAVCVDDNVMFFGGGDLERVHNDIIVLDTEHLGWTRPTIGGQPPDPRAGHSAVVIGYYVFLVGGGDVKNIFGDMMVLDTGSTTPPLFIPSLEAKLKARPAKSELIARDILKPDNIAPSLYARQQSIKRSHISQKLTKFLSSRPTEQQLVMQHVLPAALTPESPGMDVTRTTLQRLLEQRPVREQLVQRHILPDAPSYSPQPQSQYAGNYQASLVHSSPSPQQVLERHNVVSPSHMPVRGPQYTAPSYEPAQYQAPAYDQPPPQYPSTMHQHPSQQQYLQQLLQQHAASQHTSSHTTTSSGGYYTGGSSQSSTPSLISPPSSMPSLPRPVSPLQQPQSAPMKQQQQQPPQLRILQRTPPQPVSIPPLLPLASTAPILQSLQSQSASGLHVALTGRSRAIHSHLQSVRQALTQPDTSIAASMRERASNATSSGVSGSATNSQQSGHQEQVQAPLSYTDDAVYKYLSPLERELINVLNGTDTLLNNILHDLHTEITRREQTHQRELDELRRQLLEQQSRREREITELTQLLQSRELRVQQEMEMMQQRLVQLCVSAVTTRAAEQKPQE